MLYSSLKYITFLLVIFTIPAFVSAQSSFPHNDVDGDGVTDVITVQDEGDNSKNTYVYQIFLSETEEEIEIQHGRTGDIIAPGDYDGDGTTDITIVREDNDNNVLKWITYLNPSESTIEEWGVPNDYVIGCDFDNDETTDRAVLRDGVLIFDGSTDGSTSVTLPFAEGETPKLGACGDIDGDGALDLILILTLGSSERLVIYNISEESGVELFSTKISKSTSLIVGDSQIFVHRAKKNRKFLRTFTSTGDGENLAFTKRNSRLGRKGQSLISLIDENSASSLLFFGRLNRFFSFNSNRRLSRNRSMATLKGDSLLPPVTLGSTGNPTSTTPPEEEEPPGSCTSIEEFRDGNNSGRLLKQAEHGGTVVLIPQCEYTASKLRFTENGVLLYKLVNTGLANPSICGLRMHFRARDRNLNSFPNSFTVEVIDTKGKLHCYAVIDNNGRRID